MTVVNILPNGMIDCNTQVQNGLFETAVEKSGLAHSNDPIHVKKIGKFNFKIVWPLIWFLRPLLTFLKFFSDP